MRSCTDCQNRYLRDYGYSDYTVEGTDIYCRHDLNPGYPDEEPRYTEAQKPPHTFASECDRFIAGDEDIPHFSVDEDVVFPVVEG